MPQESTRALKLAFQLSRPCDYQRNKPLMNSCIRRHEVLARCLLGAIVAFGPAQKAHAAERPWTIVQRLYPATQPVTASATVTNPDGYVFSVYGMPQQVMRWRFEVPDASDIQIDPTRLVSLIIDDYAPYTIKADPELQTTLRRNLLHVDAKAVDWEMGQYVPKTWPANFAFRLQTGSRLLVQIPLASGETREVSFTLKGAKAALATLVGPFTPEYEEQYRREEQRFRDEAVLTKAQAGAEARCGVPVNDKTSPCAAKIRECINAHDADVLQPAEGEALRRCFEAIRP